MNAQRAKLVSGHSYMQRQIRQMHKDEPGRGAIVGVGRVATETGRFVSDFGRQVFLFAGLLILVGIILAATTGNQMFASFIYWTGWFRD